MSSQIHLFLLILLFSQTVIRSQKVTLLHVNDIHSHFEEVNINTGTCKQGDKDKGVCYGGLSRIFSYVKDVRRVDPESILLNAGDFYQGTMWYTIFKYQPVIEFSNLLNYTSGSLGNHDWDDGGEGLKPFVTKANFPLLAANVLSEAVPNIRSSVVVSVQGVKVGIIGYVTPETVSISNPGNKTYFYDIIPSVREEAKTLKSLGVNILIAVGHAGYNVDKELARTVEELDVVVGGHSHTFLYTGKEPSIEKAQGNYPTLISQESGKVVPVVQAYCYTKYLGHLELQFDEEGELLKPVETLGVWFAQPILLDSNIAKDEWIEAKFEKYLSVLRPYKDVVGSTLGSLERNENNESLLGNVVTDSMLSVWNEAEIAFINDGGLRSDLSPGDITSEDVLSVLPFNNTIDLVELRGADILQVLEWNIAGLCPNMSCEAAEFYQMAGMRVQMVISENNQGSRVVKAEVREENGEHVPIDENRTYRVAITSFLTLPGKSPVADLMKNKMAGVTDYDALVEYLDMASPIMMQTQGRIQLEYRPTL